ncbi:MAG TPA: alpha/beta hydrolase [Mycobacteriales bacterium]|nr:alpha/beta hydrolase [Mycobacteriales bacterium]
MRTSRIAGAALAAALALTACQGKPARDAGPTATPTTPATTATGTATTPVPSASPTAADPEATIARYAADPPRWTGCGDGFECARLTVPLDYAKPAGGDMQVALIRLKARQKSKRIGSVVLNPGGPGGSGVEFARQAEQLLPGEILDRFDVVSFDPRGVGESTPVDCLDDAQLDRLVHADPTPDTPAERAALFRLSREEAAACQAKSGRLLPHLGTVDTAKDMEVLRRVLGDDKLTYVGFSYGTVLGARYAEQFPSRVRALVLDGALDPTLSASEVSAAQAEGFDRALTQFLNDCRSRSCAFARHGDPFATFDTLVARADSRPLTASRYPDRLAGQSEVLFGTAAALYSPEYGWPALRDALEAAWTQHDASGLLALFDNLVERDQNGHFSNSLESQAAISCVDGVYPKDEAAYDADAKAFAKRAPRFGPAIAYGPVACAYWPVPPVSRPGPARAPGAPPILVVGTTRDPATPYAWSVALAEQLRGALLTHVGDGHTAYGYGRDACVDRIVDAYLISLTVPKAGARCA